MGRPLAVRINYLRDAQTLQRVIVAVQSDESRPADWRREAVEHLSAVITLFNVDAVSRSPPPRKR